MILRDELFLAERLQRSSPLSTRRHHIQKLIILRFYLFRGIVELDNYTKAMGSNGN